MVDAFNTTGTIRTFALVGEHLTDSRHYELSMLVREFFPGAESLRPEQEEAADALFLFGNDGIRMTVRKDGVSAREEFCRYPEASVLSASAGDPFKNELKRALYELLRRLSGESLPWGILTGVRPTKLAWKELDRGLDRASLVRLLHEEYYLEERMAERLTDITGREMRLLEGHSGTDYSLYVGIPFCPTRCAYCSFVSYDFHRLGDLLVPYTDALCEEIKASAKLMNGRRLQSFYMGGGTPTTLPPELLRKVLQTVEEAFSVSSIAEKTVEAGRPDTITADRLSVLREFGITRISVNPQTMVQKTLDLIGRRHTVEDIRRAYALAREEGFDNINMDLIMGLPEEGIEEARYTLDGIRKMAPDSLTVHTLAVKRSSRIREEGTASTEGRTVRRMLDAAEQTARELGMKPYYMYRQKNMAGNFENTGYSVPGKECLYNVEIMEERQSILACGAGAVSKIYSPEADRIDRAPNVKNVEEYIRRLPEMLERKRAFAGGKE